MPMIDVYATAGTFPDRHQLAVDLATAVMTIEQVPDIPMFRQNTAAFIHDLPAGSLLMLAGFLGAALAVGLAPQHGTGWATFAPVLVAGIGGGMVVAPNQSLALSGVPLSQAGTAAGLLQTGQRIGASIGIAAAGAAFFSTLRGHGSFADAYRNGIVVTASITAAALPLALIDRRRGRRARDEAVRPCLA